MDNEISVSGPGCQEGSGEVAGEPRRKLSWHLGRKGEAWAVTIDGEKALYRQMQEKWA